MSYSSYGIEKGQLIRQPSTANLMVDSADRDALSASPWDFSITRRNQLINGYFTRAGTTEVVLEWCDGNIWIDNSSSTYDVSGATVRNNDEVVQLVLGGFYTVADALDELVGGINDLSGTTGVSIKVVTNQGIPFLSVTGGHVLFNSGSGGLLEALGITPLDVEDTAFFIRCPDLRRYRYLDFTSSQLTAVQDVKDSTTAPFARDVLCRWYMAEDSPEPEDKYGFPILMGYKSFQRRRLFNPPKQIKWEQNTPVGNLAFTIYSDDGLIPIALDIAGNPTASESQWLMTIQLSEG
jgi:hypothetical protein